MKLMSKDRGVTLACVAVLLLAVVAVFTPVLAQAKNSTDTRFSRYVSSYNMRLITASRRKEDVSPMYTFNDKSSSAYKAKGVGRYNANQGTNDYKCDEGAALDNKLCSRGYSYHIRTNVYERGSNYGSLMLYPQFSTGTINMLWSPDSL